MSTTLHLAGAAGRPWARVGRAWATGTGYLSAGSPMDAAALAAHLDGSQKEFASRVAALSGTFAAVHTSEHGLLAATDRIRSIPLFFSDTAGPAVLSDDARWLAERVSAAIDSPEAVAELMLASCTTGSSTLCSDVKQVQAGEIWRAGSPAGDDRYFRFGAGTAMEADEEELLVEAVRLFEGAFDALLASVAGRPVAIPLSGGIDSRVIAGMLVRGGRTDAACFTYGRPRSRETRASRVVAAHLGLRWTFEPYTSLKWYRWFRTPEFQRFRRAASGLTTIEHEQDWPAVRELMMRGFLEPGTVVVPGHAGDFLGGSHLPPGGLEDPVAAAWKRYYVEWPASGLDDALSRRLRQRVSAAMDGMQGAAAFTAFGWQERQAKMIANSVRVYEDHGLGWRLPFWADADVLDFWGRIPLALRHNRRFYLRVARRLVEDVFALPSTIRPETPLAGRLRRVTDADYRRYGIWLGRAPLARGPLSSVASRARVDHPVVGPVVHQLARPVMFRPLQWVPINGLLALEQLRMLAREIG
jgi:asparagine synthase (glutamine-hydrolysing)